MTMCLSILAKAGFFSQITQGLTWKETHDEVTAAAMYMKDTLAAEGFQQTISFHLLIDFCIVSGFSTEGRIIVYDTCGLGRKCNKIKINKEKKRVLWCLRRKVMTTPSLICWELHL
ncbi:unnamed protein product [Brassica napus]|uniref:(rape) hypothetical protein n=1 Tax=Brassica napus TaxID=3708 RepID=A0A817BB05_BRANA|nr:unnamed protein product [Brassica napus]